MAEGTSESFAQGLVGVVLDGRYRLDAVLGEGGMGAVFRAYHLAMDRKVAVKLLKPHLTNDETALRRFAREAKSTLKVDSPHAVKVLDFGVTPLKDYYMVLEYLDGRTVQRELEIDGPFAPARVVAIARQVLLGLGAAHNLGLVHRDVKPDNVLLMRVGDNADFAKVLDFGVAKLMEGSALAAGASLALTQAGMVFGTPEFMSPEQACGLPLDGRSDLYSLAATMFAMLTGCGLFEGTSAIEWLTHHARTPPPHLGEVSRELAPYRELDAVLQRCLAKQRDDRPQDANAMSALLARVEPLVQTGVRAAQVAGTPLRPTLFSPSSYLAALPGAAVGPTAATANQRVEPTSSMSESSGESIVPPQRRRRGAVLVVAAVALVGAATMGLVVATSRSASISADAGTQVAVTHTDAVVPGDAAVVAISVDADAPPIRESVDAAVIAVTPDAPRRDHHASTHDHPVAPAIDRAKLEENLAQAEAAHSANNHLGQLSAADMAHQADPTNVRAQFLYGDALLLYNDRVNGCRYLRAINRYPEARARADEAGCK